MNARPVLHLLLLIVAVVCFSVAWWIASGPHAWTNPTPWGYFGLATFAASFLP